MWVLSRRGTPGDRPRGLRPAPLRPRWATGRA